MLDFSNISRIRMFRSIQLLVGLTVVGWVLTFSNSALAVEVTPKSTIRQPRLPFPSGVLTLRMQYESYLSKTEDLNGLSAYEQIDGRLQLRSEGPGLLGTVDIGGGVAANQTDYRYIFVPELYTGWRQETGPFGLYLGRRKDSWSRLDEQWQFGLWQPLFRWDALRPEAQGLTGLFVDFSGEQARFQAFGSPLFLPEQGAPFQLSNGRFQSASPWFVEPPGTLVFRDEATSIQYNLDDPELRDIVLNPSAGALARIGREDRGPWLQGAYAYKPRNSIAVPIGGYLDVGTSGRPQARVTITPEVIYHRVSALDFGWRLDRNNGVWIAGLYEKPLARRTRDVEDPSLTWQELEEQAVAAVGVDGRLWPTRRWGPRVALSFLRQYEEKSRERGLLATEDQSLFTRRIPFARALSAQAISTLWRRGEREVEVSARVIQDLAEDGVILSTRFLLKATRALSVTAGADVLGTRKSESVTSDFISRFRSNDRVFAGVGYAF